MKKELTPEQRAKRLGSWVKVGSFVVLGLVVAPIVGLAIYGLMGIVVAALIGFTAIAVAPVVGMKLENAKLKALKAEARRNPVETLQSEFMRRQDLLEEKRTSIE